ETGSSRHGGRRLDPAVADSPGTPGSFRAEPTVATSRARRLGTASSGAGAEGMTTRSRSQLARGPPSNARRGARHNLTHHDVPAPARAVACVLQTTLLSKAAHTGPDSERRPRPHGYTPVASRKRSANRQPPDSTTGRADAILPAAAARRIS